MAVDSSYVVYGAIIVLAYLTLQHVLERKRTPKGYRPIPRVPGWPIVGNTFQLGKHPQKTTIKWAKQYGEIYELNVRGMRIVMFGTREAIKDVFERQSAVTSSRMPLPAMNEVISGGFRMLMMPYGQKWRQLRAIVHKTTTPKASDAVRPSQEFESKQLAFDILTNNEDSKSFYDHTRRYTTSVMMTVTYGKRMPTSNHEDIKQVYKAMGEMGQLVLPRGFLVDSFPVLAKLPMWMQTWRKKAKEYYYGQEKIWTRLYGGLLKELDNGTAPDCFVKQIAEEETQRRGISDVQAAFVAGSVIEAGSETTAGLLNSIWKYVAANPRVQAAAHEELSRVVGEGRSPTFSDMENLPYISAITKEVLRFRPVAAFALVHSTTGDVVYKDYFIPNGTTIGYSMVATHFDDTYEDPFEFRPERHLGSTVRFGTSLTNPDTKKRVTYAFGSGRRMCPGVHLAENSLFIVAARILWAFELKPALDEHGQEILVDVSDEAYIHASIVVPKSYSLRFVPRSPQREKVVRDEWKSAEVDGYWLGNIKVDKNGMLSKESQKV
ncbi:putative O-methylsterigmatocystin oxidoreductase [Dactylonectria macrodidyma]|uniref:O-methylsterigmatocystin oxidoreductase n=1 Tax=Dactylonectria macrodidyma TaxID=307937 RepID=A0A9P9J5I5_9HYPO|nr:putative O-methylsterigmatocystin oxidoreductase [Dactylonectria macrodidyma]